MNHNFKFKSDENRNLHLNSSCVKSILFWKFQLTQFYLLKIISQNLFALFVVQVNAIHKDCRIKIGFLPIILLFSTAFIQNPELSKARRPYKWLRRINCNSLKKSLYEFVGYKIDLTMLKFNQQKTFYLRNKFIKRATTKNWISN